MNKRIYRGSLMLSLSVLCVAYVAEVALTLLFIKDKALTSLIIETLLFGFLVLLSIYISKRTSDRVTDDITESIHEIVLDKTNDGKGYPELEPLLRRLAEQSSELEMRIEELKEEYERQDKMRSEFTANVSHELKTPLTSISGFAEIIRDGLVPVDTIPRFAGNIYTEAQRLIVLVGDIIKLSQLDEAVTITKEVTDLYESCEAAMSHLRSVAEDKEITLSLKGEHLNVFGADQVLDEMIYNLCDNAIKYNKVGGRVDVSIYTREGRAVLAVKDTGIGIPEADTARVFQRFYRVNKSHSKEIGGTGLGLSIVKHGALFHEAEIEIDSRIGEGTEIRIVFPTVKLNENDYSVNMTE